MKKFLSIAILLSGISFGSFAQERINKSNPDKKSYVRKEFVRKDIVKLSPEEIAKKRTDQLEKELKLTSKQRNEVYKLQLDQAKMHKKQREVKAKELEKSRKERLAQRSKLEKILTPQQRELWKNKYAKRSEGNFKKDGERNRKFDRHEDSKRRIENKRVDRDRRVG